MGSSGSGVAILLRLAGVKPNSDAIRIMISACQWLVERFESSSCCNSVGFASAAKANNTA